MDLKGKRSAKKYRAAGEQRRTFPSNNGLEEDSFSPLAHDPRKLRKRGFRVDNHSGVLFCHRVVEFLFPEGGLASLGSPNLKTAKSFVGAVKSAMANNATMHLVVIGIEVGCQNSAPQT